MNKPYLMERGRGNRPAPKQVEHNLPVHCQLPSQLSCAHPAKGGHGRRRRQATRAISHLQNTDDAVASVRTFEPPREERTNGVFVRTLPSSGLRQI